MSGSTRIDRVLGEWIAKAESDLTNAVLTLKAGATAPTDTICFHAQQCAEKYLKALLAYLDIDPPKTHDLRKLVSLLPAKFLPVITNDEQDRLTSYATDTRYPGGAELGQAEARAAVRIAPRVRTQVRRMPPRRALVRPKRPAAAHPNSRHPR